MSLLEQSEQYLEEATPTRSAVRSPGELEILALLRPPAIHPPSLEEVRHEHLSTFSELRIQNSVLSLLEKGLIEVVYTFKVRIGPCIDRSDNHAMTEMSSKATLR
jgi:hypothetical protein